MGGRGNTGSRSSVNVGQKVAELQAFQGDKSEKVQKRRDFAKWLDSNATNMEKSVNAGEHFIAITGGIPWYQNKSGTIFLLGTDAFWHRIGNDLTLYRERKVSTTEVTRIKLLGGKS